MPKESFPTLPEIQRALSHHYERAQAYEYEYIADDLGEALDKVGNAIDALNDLQPEG